MKIAVLLSGGVDSSVALNRLKSAGFDNLKAFYLKIWLEDDTAYMGECPWEEDLNFASQVCKASGVALEIVPLQLEYYDRVVSYALDELKRGHTPSPDIFCNQRIKFGAFFETTAASFDKVASGHYARLEWTDQPRPGASHSDVEAWSRLGALEEDAGKGPGRWKLSRAPDPIKDQSYFLSHLSQQQLAKMVFPIGNLPKTSVRGLAQEFKLANKDRPDSQGICFLGKIRYPEFVRHYLGTKDGPIVELSSGLVLGRHDGFWFFTVGQRTGLKLGNGPWYVAAKDAMRNIVYAAHANQEKELSRTQLEIAQVSWLSDQPPSDQELQLWNAQIHDEQGTSGLFVKLRHGPQLIACTLESLGQEVASTVDKKSDETSLGHLKINLATADRGIAPGQFAVLYLGEECLGGGKIQAHGLADLEVLHQRFVSEQLRQENEAAALLANKKSLRRLARSKRASL